MVPHYVGQMNSSISSDTYSNNTFDPASYTSQLKSFMQQICPTSVRQQQQRKTLQSYLHAHLFSSGMMEYVKHSLQAPYDKPYHVLKRHHKHHTLDISRQTKLLTDLSLPILTMTILLTQLQTLPFHHHWIIRSHQMLRLTPESPISATTQNSLWTSCTLA